jgi:hypothetical protein
VEKLMSFDPSLTTPMLESRAAEDVAPLPLEPGDDGLTIPKQFRRGW